MPHLLWTMCCAEPIVDQRNNILSLIHIVEEVTVRAPGAVAGDLIHVVTLWQKQSLESGEPEDFRYRIRFLSPSGETLSASPEMNASIPQERLRAMVAIQGLPLRQSGNHHWVIEVEEDGKWPEKGRLPLMVKIQPLPPVQA